MSALNRRLSALEDKVKPTPLAPHLKQWLGIKLTPAEQEEADCYEAAPDFGDVDWSKFSPEVREWLQQ